MFKRFGAVAIALMIGVLGLQAPVQAVAYDFAVTGTAVASSGVVPSVITWTLKAESVGDPMGPGLQSVIVNFTAPSSISVVISDDCDTTGLEVTCSGFFSDTVDKLWEVHGFVSLTALGAITIRPEIISTTPRADSVAANDSDTVTCTAITSLIITC